MTRISQAIKPVASDGINQVVYYQVLPSCHIVPSAFADNSVEAGIGTTGSFFSRVIGGATAEGLSENIRSAYAFIANKYVSLLNPQKSEVDNVLEATLTATKSSFSDFHVEPSRHVALQVSSTVPAC